MKNKKTQKSLEGPKAAKESVICVQSSVISPQPADKNNVVLSQKILKAPCAGEKSVKVSIKDSISIGKIFNP